MADKNSEQIKYETELLKLMAIFILAVGGGAIGLLLGEGTNFRLVLGLSGLAASLVLATGVWKQHRTIRRLMSRIKET